MKKLILLCLLFCYAAPVFAYQYSYIPKTSTPVIYNFVYKKREKCTTGKRYAYPKQVGVCASCPNGTEYIIESGKSKPFCYKCPPGTLLATNGGYAMCLSLFPVKDGKALDADGEVVNREELERLASRLSADYKTSLVPIKNTEEKTFRNKEKLKDICPELYPQAPEAQRQVEICRKLGRQNDFLCPYVEKNSDNEWICRACPKNAPYKNRQGGCFNCPYGEEMVSLPDGSLVCASEAPPPPKKKPAPKKKAPVKKTVPKKK